MSETLATAGPSGTEAEIPDYPMARNEGCPFAPPPDVMALAEERPLSRVRIWDGSTPWLITGYEQVRSITADIAGDREAAERVELVLPETGVCNRSTAPGVTECCGGPAPAEVNACCVADAEAKKDGKAGCGCA